MSLLTVMLISGLSFTLGMILSGLIFSRPSAEQKKSSELEKHLHDKQDEIKHYQQNVKEHLSKTSFLFKQLADNYRQVHNHLAQGADDLCAVDPNDPMIKKLPDREAIDINEAPNQTHAPLDYAPKATPYDKSALSEDYQLEKVMINEPIADSTADVIVEQTTKY